MSELLEPIESNPRYLIGIRRKNKMTWQVSLFYALDREHSSSPFERPTCNYRLTGISCLKRDKIKAYLAETSDCYQVTEYHTGLGVSCDGDKQQVIKHKHCIELR